MHPSANSNPPPAEHHKKTVLLLGALDLWAVSDLNDPNDRFNSLGYCINHVKKRRRVPMGNATEKEALGFPAAPKEAQRHTHFDDTEWIFDDEQNWCEIQPGDTWQGKVLIPIPLVPLPIDQQYVGGIRLVRGWDIVSNPGSLRALANSHIWTAEAQESHDVPKLHGGNSGFFGFHEWEHADHELGHSSDVAWGTYIGWGRAVRGTKGFRCQFAKIESLIINDDQVGTEYGKTIGALADQYKVPLITRSQAERLQLGLVPFTEEMK